MNELFVVDGEGVLGSFIICCSLWDIADIEAVCHYIMFRFANDQPSCLGASLFVSLILHSFATIQTQPIPLDCFSFHPLH